MDTKPGFARELYDWMKHIVYVFVCFVCLFLFGAGNFTVVSASMAETIQIDERVMVARFPFTPERGDIIMFSKHDWQVSYDSGTGQYTPIVKRVIGLPGDTLDFIDGALYINDEKQDEMYVRETVWAWRGDMITPLTVPEGCVFVMGDNRNNSHDSRFRDVGFVDIRSILGRVIWRVAPFRRFGPVS